MKIFAIVNILCATIYLESAINLTNEQKLSIFNKIVVEIIEDCYPNLKSVLLHGEYIDGVAENLQKLERMNLVLQGNISDELSDPVDFHRRIESLIIVGNSSKDISWIKNYNITSVMKLKLIFIFNISDTCNYQNSFNFAWILGITSAFHICVFSETHQEIITFNPINNYAPNSWKFKSKQILKNYSPASIFYQNYTKETICRDFEFDRTKILNGHTMNAIAVKVDFDEEYWPNSIIDDQNFDNFTEEIAFNEFITLCFIKSFNVSMNITYVPLSSKADLISDRNRLLKESVDFSVDMASPAGRRFDDWKYIELSYPLLISNDVIVTHKQGLLSTLEKIFNYYGWVTIISATIILSITFGVVYRVENKRLSFAFFECLRLVTNTHLYTRMTSFKIRIFFFVVFLYFLIIQATFSGHLTLFLTKPELRKNVETIDDLSDSRYAQIYARLGAEAYFTNKSFENKVNFTFDYCDDRIDKNISVACVDDFIRLIMPIAHNDLHYTERMGHNIWSLPMRKNWILKDRVNKILMWLDQSGISEKLWIDVHSEYYHNITKQGKSLSLVDYYRPIILDDLLFIFIFLVIGLLFSLIVFIVERDS